MEAQNATVVQPKKTSSGLDENVAGLLCYILGWVTGLVFLLIEKDNRFVKFHAWQSIAVSVLAIPFYIIITILGFIPVIGFILGCFAPLIVLGLHIFLMVQAYQGKMYKLPVVGDFIEKNLMK